VDKIAVPQDQGRQLPERDVDTGWLCPILRHPDRYPLAGRPADCPADSRGIISPALVPACLCRGPAGIYPD